MLGRRLRRSRSSRASAGPRERAKNSTPRSIHRSAGARIVKDAAHHLLGIAPQKLLFHASVKNDPILSSLTSSRIQSAGLAIIEVVRVKRMLIAGPGDSASVIDLPPHRQNTMTPSAIRSPTVRKAGC
jgi:hypothetical protein